MQTSPQLPTRNTENQWRIPIHRIVIKRSSYPRKTIKCQFLCFGANNMRRWCGHWTLESSTASESPPDRVSAPQRAVFDITSPQRVWWARRKLVNYRLCCPISYLCHHTVITFSSSSSRQHDNFLKMEMMGPDLNVQVKHLN